MRRAIVSSRANERVRKWTATSVAIRGLGSCILDLDRRIEKEASGFAIESAKRQSLAHDPATRPPRNMPFARFSSCAESAAAESDAQFRWREPIAFTGKGSKRQFEVHGENLARGKPSGRWASENEGSGLCGRALDRHLLRHWIFWVRLFSAVQLQDGSDPNLPDALRGFGPLADIFPTVQFAFQLDMCAFFESRGELRELAEDDATVPFGVRDELVALSVGGLGG